MATTVRQTWKLTHISHRQLTVAVRLVEFIAEGCFQYFLLSLLSLFRFVTHICIEITNLSIICAKSVFKDHGSKIPRVPPPLRSCLGRGLEPAHEAVLPAEGVQLGLMGRQLVRLIGQENGWNWSAVVQGHLRREEGQSNISKGRSRLFSGSSAHLPALSMSSHHMQPGCCHNSP